MRRVHTARTLADAYLVRHVLEAEDIATSVRGEHLVGAAGEVPVSPDTWPSVWVGADDEARAHSVLEAYNRASGEVQSEEQDDGAGQEMMAQLFVTADRLRGDPLNGALLDQVRAIAAHATGGAPPYGVERDVWDGVVQRAAEVAAIGDGWDRQDAADRIAALHAALRPLV